MAVLVNEGTIRCCIWCSKAEPDVLFYKKAHTIPQALGGKNVCANVCDSCNAFFGNTSNQAPAVESVIKETFNISRARLLSSLSGVGKNKSMARFKSMYFKVDFEKRKLGVKPQYKYNKYFQTNLGRQFKKGLYKIFLEETERQRVMGHNSQFDFIREFSRFDLGDYPVIYFERLHGIIMLSEKWVENPELFLSDKMQFKYLISHPCFFEFELLGHVFAIAITRNWHLGWDDYIRSSIGVKRSTFKSAKFVERFDDVDFMLHVIDKSGGDTTS